MSFICIRCQRLKHLLQRPADRQNEIQCRELFRIFDLGDESEVSRHLSALDGLKRSPLKLIRELAQLIDAVKLSSLSECACPCKNRRDRICRSEFSLKMLIVMSLDRAVSCFLLIIALR